ncbi:MAG: TonB-dependent receptor plug domain-containing protein, partial [Prevotellaceae bacterium]|nr:TonB-dependent receptor plug domain-containing protein [Prevotellaceae bacterium]
MKQSFLWALLIALASIGHAQTQTSITGKVSDAATGEPIPFVNVIVKGSINGVFTDDSGNYSILVPSGSTALIFSEVGHEDLEVEIGGRTVINVAMNAGVAQLDEVVVVAYGTSKREAITGSVTTMNATEIERRPVANISAAMQGLGTGIIVSNSYGEPGNVGTVRIRGFGSITGNNDPLYVVDGAPYSGSINAINPNDIENISVLKDA